MVRRRPGGKNDNTGRAEPVTSRTYACQPIWPRMPERRFSVSAPTEQLIDVHAYFIPPDYVEAALAAGHVKPDGMKGWPDWSAASHLELMNR
jgi:hypothetical protein